MTHTSADADRASRLMRAGEEFERAYLSCVELDTDRAASVELRREASPAIDALLRWLQMGPEAPDSLRRSETLAMGSLLGRRAARLGVSPSAALGLVNGLLAPLRAQPDILVEVEHALRAVCLEGYVAASAEQSDELRGARWVEQTCLLPVADHALLLVLEGRREAAQLNLLGERFARELFRREARAGWIDLTGLWEPSRARAGALLGIDESARTLGCPLVFSGVDDGWREALQDASADFELLRLAPSFAEGLQLTLSLMGREIRPRGSLASALLRLRGAKNQ